MIQRLYVHNFRCLENFELNLKGRPSTLLIGKNGAGKSTVGRVLEILQSAARGTNRIAQLFSLRDLNRLRPEAPLRIDLDVNLGGSLYRYTLALELPDGFRELRVKEESLTTDGEIIYSRDVSDVAVAGGKNKASGQFRVDWHLIALPVIQERSEKDPLSIFKRWLAQMVILAPIPSLIGGDSSTEALLPSRSAENFGEWFSGLIAHSPAAYSKIDEFLKSVMPDLWDVKNPLIGADSRSIQVQFRADAGSLVLPFADLSDGEKYYFVAALTLAANEFYGPVFCFWDEPDNYLSLDEVGYLTTRLRQSFESGGQLLITSHNPEAIRRFSGDSTLLLFRRNHLEPTQVRPVSDLEIPGDLVGALTRGDLEV